MSLATALTMLSWALPAGASPPPPPPPPPPASDGAKDVDELNAEAVQKFKDKEYEEAISLFEQAYALSPEPNYLFNIGRVYEEKGDFPKAIEHYDRFINSPEVELRARDLALERLRVLRAIMAETKVEDPTAAEPEADEQPTGFVLDTPPPSASPRMPPLRVAGLVLIGVSVAALGAGAGLGGAALGRTRALEDTRGLEARDAIIRRGQGFAKAADGLFIAGGVLAATGLALALASLRRPRGASASRPSDAKRSATLAPALGRGELGFAFVSRF